MKTGTGEDNPLTFTAPSAVTGGVGFLLGIIFGVAVASVSSGKQAVLERRGRHNLPMLSTDTCTAWTTKLYWDNTNKRLTTTSSGNTYVGVPTTDKASGPATIEVLLHGQLA